MRSERERERERYRADSAEGKGKVFGGDSHPCALFSVLFLFILPPRIKFMPKLRLDTWTLECASGQKKPTIREELEKLAARERKSFVFAGVYNIRSYIVVDFRFPTQFTGGKCTAY